MEVKPEKIDFRNVDFSDIRVMDDIVNRRRRCPVIVTLVDTQITPVDIQQMLEGGMNGAKFKMSYSTAGDKIRLLGKVDKAAAACCKKYGVDEWPVATSVELRTCIVKTGMLEADKEYVILKQGKEVVITCNIAEYNKCSENKIFVDNKYISNDVKVGMEISIDAAEIILKCIQVVDEKCIKCLVTKTGKLSDLCNVCVRSVKHSQPDVSKKDLEIVRFALEYQVDMIIINYVRHPETLKKIKEFIPKNVKRPLLIGGICTQEGLDNFDDIIRESDGIILSREYLPYELDVTKRYRLSQIQKWMAGKCLQAGKPLYISGIFQNAFSTGYFDDTEVSDITNALLDGASGFILKDCYDPQLILKALRALKTLCYSVEPLLISKTAFQRINDEPNIPLNAAEALVVSCAAMANYSNATLVMIPTVTGKTIKALHLMRLSCIVIALSSNISVIRMLQMYRSIYPILYTGVKHKDFTASVEARISFGLEFAVKSGWVAYGDMYVALHKDSASSSFCDIVRILKVAVTKKALVECPGEDEDVDD